MPDFTTGFSVLPDIGILAYNGVIFSSLYHSRIEGRVVPDAANRTTKLLEYSLDVMGVVTLGTGDKTTDNTWEELREKLSQHGGYLTCQGKGFGPLNVNPPVGGIGNPNIATTRDVAWGPVPTIISFQPLGASRSAFIHWTCVTRVVEESPFEGPQGPGENPFRALQFNWDYELTYDSQGYSSYSVKGTLEIPLTRSAVADRAVRQTVDDFRSFWLDLQTDLLNFRVTNRHFGFSRDKRTCEWNFACEELPPMGIPPGCTEARGTMSVRNSGGLGGGSRGKIGMIFWTVSLRATYTVRGDYDQRVAAFAFYALLWYRIQQSRNAKLPLLNNNGNAPQQAAGDQPAAQQPDNGNRVGDIDWWNDRFGREKPAQKRPPELVMLTDFGWDEGLYLDSKTITFHASWWLSTTFASIFNATGIWHWLEDTAGGNIWAASIADVAGASSWLFNRLDKTQDVIVDFNGGDPPLQPPVKVGR